MSTVVVYSYSHSATYVADNILKTLKDIIRLSGLDPTNLVGDWDVLLRGINQWIESQHLELVTLEIFNASTEDLITRWDLSVSYSWDINSGTFWTDTDQLKYALKKAGLVPAQANYRIVVHNKEGRPEVAGWKRTSYRSTDGMVRQSLGTTVEHNGLGASASYWRNI